MNQVFAFRESSSFVCVCVPVCVHYAVLLICFSCSSPIPPSRRSHDFDTSAQTAKRALRVQQVGFTQFLYVYTCNMSQQSSFIVRTFDWGLKIHFKIDL